MNTDFCTLYYKTDKNSEWQTTKLDLPLEQWEYYCEKQNYFKYRIEDVRTYTDERERMYLLRKSLIDWNGNDILISYETDEFTVDFHSTTGQADLYTINISYKPTKKYIESKGMESYLMSFSRYNIEFEHLANNIANEIKKVTEAKYVRVECKPKAKYGLKMQSIVELGEL